MSIGLHVKYLLFFWYFNEIWIFLTDFFKNTEIKLMKVRLEGAELLHTDGQTDMTKLIIAFRNFVKASKNEQKFFNIWRF